jgi:hypothetical protein
MRINVLLFRPGLSSRIELYIVVESLNGYSDAHNQR